MKKLLRNNLLSLVGLILGALSGFFYWLEIGCLSGSCTITSSPINSTIYGAIMGFLLFGFFKRQKK